MRILLYSVAVSALMLFGTTGCDMSEQNVSWQPGDSLFVVGPVDAAGTGISAGVSENGLPLLLSPVDAYFYVNAFSTEREYSWTVNGTDAGGMDNVAILNDGEFLRISLTAPGTYLIHVESGGLGGSQQVVVEEGGGDE